MIMAYRIYDNNSVSNAEKHYDSVANSAPVYSDSAATTQARQQADKYAESYKNSINNGYNSSYMNSINKLADKYVNNKFDYDVNSDSTYQSYSDKYKREGAKAQENVQGTYSANTGGYINSYAQTAGLRTYGEYMDELAEKIPSLKNEKMQSWQQEQENTLNQIGVLQGLDDIQYQKFRDKLQDSYDFMNYYENKYSTSKGLDMSQYQNELAKWQTRTNAAASNLSSIRQLAESQYEHNNVSADTQANIDSSKRQNDDYYNYLYSLIK